MQTHPPISPPHTHTHTVTHTLPPPLSPQDVLRLDNSAVMNRPGVAFGCWEWMLAYRGHSAGQGPGGGGGGWGCPFSHLLKEQAELGSMIAASSRVWEAEAAVPAAPGAGPTLLPAK